MDVIGHGWYFFVMISLHLELNLLSVLFIIQYSITTVHTVYMEEYLSLLYATETGRIITYNHSNIVELAPMFSKYVMSAISEVHNMLMTHCGTAMIDKPLFIHRLKTLSIWMTKLKCRCCPRSRATEILGVDFRPFYV